MSVSAGVLASLDDLPALEDVNAVGVHHSRQTMRNENGYDFA